MALSLCCRLIRNMLKAVCRSATTHCQLLSHARNCALASRRCGV
jgi:hypothetical protein